MTIDPEVVDPDDVEMLQDLVIAAVNEALRQARETAEQKMAARDRRPTPPGHGLRPALSVLVEPVARLIEAFARLPGIGPKTAQRLTYHLLRAPDGEARTLAAALVAVRTRSCSATPASTSAPGPLCPICLDPDRDDTPALRRRGAARRPGARAHRRLPGPLPRAPWRDLAHGRHRARPAARPGAPRTSPRARCNEGRPFEEVILATNPTLEGEATAMYLAERLAADVGTVTRIARGIPVGGDLEYADEVTLVRAMQGRRELEVGGRSRAGRRVERPCRRDPPSAGQGAGVAILGLVIYLVATGLLGEPGSVTLALLCWIAAAAFWLLVETSPL